MALKRNLMTTLLISLTLATPARAFEIDSFYQRERKIKDSGAVINELINQRIQKAVSMTKSCNMQELYTNVRNQLSADSKGFGIVGGIENWAEQNKDIEKIAPPAQEKSIYSNTPFEDSPLKVGYWLDVWDKVKKFDLSKYSLDLAKQLRYKVKAMQSRTSDPLVICEVPDSQKEEAKKFVEFANHKGPPGGPPGSQGGPPAGGPQGGFPPGPPPDGDMSGAPPMGGRPPGGPGGGKGPRGNPFAKFAETETGQCLKVVLKIKDMDDGQTVKFQSVININGVHIGTDKLGHFFDQGFELFQEEGSIKNNSYLANADGLKKALEYNNNSEEGMFGLMGSGIKSYGDMSANYGGSVFWKDLTQGSNPIASCEDGKYTLKRPFDLKDYVTDAWDEGINCSGYGKEMTAQVKENLKARGLSCPVEVAKCQALSRKYSAQVLATIVSPECKSQMTAATLATGDGSTTTTQRGQK